MTQMPPPGPGPTGPVSYQTPPPGAQPGQGMAIASLVCGIVSIALLCVWWLSIPLGIVAVVLAVINNGKAARGEAGGAGLAKAGMVCGIIGAGLSLLLTVLAIVGFTMFGNRLKQMQQQQNQQRQGTTQQLVVPVPASFL